MSITFHERRAERGYDSPPHRHVADEETFLVLEGELRVELDGEVHRAGAGSVALPSGYGETGVGGPFLRHRHPGAAASP
ncbi:cupin domain-containing protein [Streptomyces sp. NPDC001852]|uniref:cupin domain-containing protein n=1 Tax=Streptomyces sp. NPDC001852 TaxID=3364619 RepID=UPI0036B92C97